MQAKEKEQKSAVAIVANLLFGEMNGPKAGPLRWVFHRRLLLDVWEWHSFRLGLITPDFVMVDWQLRCSHLPADRCSFQLSVRRACPWMRSIVARLADGAAEEFTDDQVWHYGLKSDNTTCIRALS